MSEKNTLKVLDLSTIIGIIITALLLIIAINIDGKIQNFFDIASFLIVVLGTFMLTLASFSAKEVIISHLEIFNVLFHRLIPAKTAGYQALELAISVRKEGKQKILQQIIKHKKFDSFFQHGIEMIIDNQNSNDIEKMYNQKIFAQMEQKFKVISILKKSGEIAPAMGLIGTLIGLVQLLSALDDFSQLGSAMALALLTTFYGTILAYVIFFPLASKLENSSSQFHLILQIYLKALISIANNENPRLLEEEINSLLIPKKQIKYFTPVTKT